jgi:phage baseplate assembly protein W
MSETISGFAFPFRIGGVTGGVVFASGAQKLRNNLVQLLLTDPGERVMRRDYGAGLRHLVHDPDNDALRAIVQHQVGRAVRKWEPRVQVQQVVVAGDPVPGTLHVNVTFTARPNPMPVEARVPIALGAVADAPEGGRP